MLFYISTKFRKEIFNNMDVLKNSQIKSINIYIYIYSQIEAHYFHIQLHSFRGKYATNKNVYLILFSREIFPFNLLNILHNVAISTFFR